MALPTTNLTLHCDASQVGKVFTTVNGGGSGIHTGVPADGNAIQVWEDEGDGISDVAMIFATSKEPNYRSGASSLMKNSCIDATAANNDRMSARTQDNGSAYALSSFISASAFTFAAVVWLDSVPSTTGSDGFTNNILIGDSGGYAGIRLRNVAGVPKARCYNYQGASHTAEVTISTGATWIIIARHGGGNIDIIAIDSAGNEITDGPVSSGDTESLTSSFSLFNVGDDAVNYDGRVGEIAVYNALVTGTDLTNLKDYFKNKWLNLTTRYPKPMQVYADLMRPIRVGNF